MSGGSAYDQKIREEVAHYREVTNVHDLPASFHYWSNNYLLPKLRLFGFDNAEQFYFGYMSRACLASEANPCSFLSVGAGNCETEVNLAEKLIAFGCRNFLLECLDVNPHMLERGLVRAQQRGVASQMKFTQADINHWISDRSYHVVFANHALHHFLELELLFDKIHQYLGVGGHFLTHDMIGRNGHMRWPEALTLVRTLWNTLPDHYKYNHQLKRLEIEFDNWDCSKEGFEGIRAQDILPLLVERFSFELFIGWGGVIDIFIDRSFGHNFDPAKEWDRSFIDEVHRLNEESLENGLIKPTQILAAMSKSSRTTTRQYKHLSPRFCIRRPDHMESGSN